MPPEINKQFIAVTISTLSFKGILIVSWKLHTWKCECLSVRDSARYKCILLVIKAVLVILGDLDTQFRALIRNYAELLFTTSLPSSWYNLGIYQF